MESATSYDEWTQAAKAADNASGLTRWKESDDSRKFDFATIRTRLEHLRQMRSRNDDIGLLFALNEGIHGNIGGMGNPSLYTKCRFGTKQLINDYVDEIVDSLEHLADTDSDQISFEKKLDFFRRASHCYGCSALMLSGSGSLLYFHVGVARALFQEELLPYVLSGASGGALVGSIVSSHSNSQLEQMLAIENILELSDNGIALEKSNPSFTISNLVQGLLPKRIHYTELRSIIDNTLPDLTFQEALELTGRHLNISVASVDKHHKARLLNAYTSPNVFIREAVHASCAVPGIYPAITLAAKNENGDRQPYLPSQQWVDGSVSDDLPSKRLSRLYGVNHFIVSQTNPHVIPFITDTKTNDNLLFKIKNASVQTARTWLNTSAEITREPLSFIPYYTGASNIALSILNQDYVGDINILPSKRLFNPTKLLAKRSEAEIRELILMGERSTWPKIEMIRIQTKINRALDHILRDYETDYSKRQFALENSQS